MAEPTSVFVSDPVAVKYIMVTRGYTYGKHLGVRVFFRAVEGSRYGMGSLEGKAIQIPLLVSAC